MSEVASSRSIVKQDALLGLVATTGIDTFFGDTRLRSRLRPLTMRFCYQDEFEKAVPEAYETLLWDILHGDATLFMRADQVETAWQIVEPVLSVWEDIPPLDFPNYVAGSWGPESSEVLVAADGRSWLTPTLIHREMC